MKEQTFPEAYNEAKQIASTNDLMVAVYVKRDPETLELSYFNLVVSCLTGHQKNITYIGKFVGNLPFEYSQDIPQNEILNFELELRANG